MKVLLVDNGSSLLDKLQSLIPVAEITKKWFEVSAEDACGYDLIVLSGSSTYSIIHDYQYFKGEVELVRNTKTPIIGICFGLELIVRAFGGRLKEIPKQLHGIREIELMNQELFKAPKIKVYENHRFVISKLPENFVILAKSHDGPEVIKHKDLPIYGLQFQPENFVEETEGDELFLKLLSKFK